MLLEEMTRGKNIYYHLTTKDYGPIVEFYPRRPESAFEDEPDDPRICVSPSLAGCLVAGSFAWNEDYTIYVYATKTEARPITSEEVFDADVTEEHWIEEPAVFVKVGEIPMFHISSDAKSNMAAVNMPYIVPDEEDEWEESSYWDHIRAKEAVEQDIRELEKEIHRNAKQRLASIVPRIKDIPGQGKFYFAKEEEEMQDAEKEKELVMAEAEEEFGRAKIPRVKAPGNFHQVVNGKDKGKMRGKR